MGARRTVGFQFSIHLTWPL